MTFEQQLEALFQDVNIAKAVLGAHPDGDAEAVLAMILEKANARREASPEAEAQP